MKTNQKGFSVVEGFLILVILGIIGVAGWYVMKANKNVDKTNTGTIKSSASTPSNTKKPDTSTPVKVTDQYADWDAASFELADASFKYPKNLKMDHEVKADASPNTGFETYTLTAEDNTKISLIAFHFQGGFSGDEPKTLIDDVITGTDRTNNREFSSIIYKNSNGVYDSAYVMDSTQTKYKAGQESQIFINSFGVKPKGANTARSQFSISVSGQKYQTYKTLGEIKSMGAYKDIEKFLNALNIPNAD